MKKTVIIVTFLLINTVSVFGQDCNFSVNKTDKFTKKQVLKTKTIRLATMTYGVHLRMSLNNNGDAKFISAEFPEKIGCASYDSYLIIQLENEEQIQITNSGGVDCSSRPAILCRIDEVYIKLLMESPISAIRLHTSKHTVDSRKINNSNYFIENLKCLDY
ncbi:MAG: hypothetical protein JKY22_11065 [Flavobacteriaceae bacterium]|nr:hypothetical protein [Flavobacteriaceae bacterium]